MTAGVLLKNLQVSQLPVSISRWGLVSSDSPPYRMGGLGWAGAVPWFPMTVRMNPWSMASLACPGESVIHFGVHFPSDTSLTLPNVLAVVRTVQGVERLGMNVLEVPYTKREEVKQQSTSDEEQREGMVKYFMQTHPSATWEWLGGRLLWLEEYEAVRDVKVHIKPNEGV